MLHSIFVLFFIGSKTQRSRRFFMLRYFYFILLLFFFNVKLFSQNYKHQATLLIFFSRYVNWPTSNNNEDFEICLLASKEIANDMSSVLSHRTIDGRKIIIKRCSNYTEIPRKAKLVYMSSSKSSQFQKVKEKIKKMPILFVTQKKGLAQKGSHFNIIFHKGQMKYELNKSSLQKSKLKVTSFLENLAIIYK